ncbi:GON-4-like protein [Larimichthys crocea]|nr:GON-4-like protein [Larimichthys crocea]
MAADVTVSSVERRRPAEEDVCPLQSKCLRTHRETFGLDRKSQTASTPVTGSSPEDRREEEESGGGIMKVVTMETSESSDDELGRLDIDLDRKSKQHNLTSRNVRTILHEVITHEHVVAMMKAAIRDTQDLPMFTFLSDADSLASPPRMHQGSQPKLLADEPLQRSAGHLGEQVMSSPCAPQHLLTAPESSFLERLNAVEEELDCSPTYTYNQSLDRKPNDGDDDGGGDDEGCLAYRTRSKLRLVNVPLGQLEAELLPPDITADMYEQSAARREEDRHWTKWLQGLMAPDNEEEADDDDDPEYNFLDDLDEPDLEDYRTDRAVQITKKEVNELLDELFDTLQEEDQEEELDQEQDEEVPSQTGPKFNVPQALRFEAPLASMLTERRQTVRKQYEALQQRRALQDTTNQQRDNINLKDTPSPQHNTTSPVLVLPSRVCPALHLNYSQKLQLQQQIQQHVQLLTQVHLLLRRVDTLNHEASITKHYLEELQQFARRQEEVFLPSSFRVCNLQGALDLLQEVEQRADIPSAAPAPPAASKRWLPRMTPATNSHAFPLLPADAAWLFATRPVFLYPELLPICSLDHRRHHRSVYTAGEDTLIILGLKHFEGTVQSDQLISSYLLCKTRWNLRKHIREMSGPRAPRGNVIKMFLTQRVVPPLLLACSRVQSGDQRPPVDRNTSNMPNWLKMMWTPPAPCTAPPTVTSQHAAGQQIHRPIGEEQEEMDQMSTRPHPPLEEEDRQGDRQEDRQEEEGSASLSTLSPLSCPGEKEKNWTLVGVVSLNGGEKTDGEEEGREEGGAEEGGGEEEGGSGEEEQGREGHGGEEETGGGAEGEQEGEGEEEEQREDGGGEREEDGEKDKDEDQDRQGEEEEEEDFDDLTQDEDEEEVMSSASEESVLSVPELQETMKQLTWLAAERRLCADGDSEEEHSPTSQEEEEEEEEGPKGEESGEGRSSKEGRDEEMPLGEGTPRGGGRCPGRGRGRSRPLRGLRRSRQERHSKDSSKLLLLYDENILDNDPHRESKDVAFAQSYLNRVREALQDLPGQVEEFVSLLNEFEQVGDGQEVMLLFRKLRGILGDRTDLLRDFAAFLHPEQALQCGLFEEQQAFERSRRFLRQLEISFGDNPSHYQKIIKALQTGPDLSPTSIHELKAQMASLLKGHTHLQAEFWVFFEELRPPPARPGQFEEAHWPEDGGGGSDGGEGVGQLCGGGATSGFEEVTLPELEEEEEGHKIQPITSRRQRRKMDAHRTYKVCDWSDKDWSCLCHDAKIRRHRRKGCSRCHGNKTSGGVSRAMKSLDPLYSQISSTHDESGDKDLDLKGDDDSPQPDQSSASWEGSFPLTNDKEEEEELEEDEEEDDDEEEKKNREKEQSLELKRSRREEAQRPSTTSSMTFSTTSSNPITSSMVFSVTSSISPVTDSIFTSTSVTSSVSSISLSVCTSTSPTSSAPPRPSPPPDLPVCAKNISLTASGEKVILWTREADRVILTTCQQEGANQNTFQAISTLLGNKTPSEVSHRFRDLMRLFRTAARQTSSEDEALPIEATAANQVED